MSANINGLLIILILFGSTLAIIGLLYLLFTCYKKIKHRRNPSRNLTGNTIGNSIGDTEPFLVISY